MCLLPSPFAACPSRRVCCSYLLPCCGHLPPTSPPAAPSPPPLPPRCLQPDVATRLFLRKLKQTLRIPVLALVDSDPYGLKILSVYMKGEGGGGGSGQGVRAASHASKGLLQLLFLPSKGGWACWVVGHAGSE